MTAIFFSLSEKVPQAPNPSSVLGVFGLSIRTTERDLDEEFTRFGHVEKVTIVYDQRVSFNPVPSDLTPI
jgi:RNA recognition motif-containing protein